MTRELPLLLNSAASRRALRGLERAAADRGLRPVRTDDAADLARRLRRLIAAGAERVAVAGGDGTVHVAAQVLAGSATALAVVPLGTGNDTARALGLPLDAGLALDRASTGSPRRIDLGLAAGRRFVGVLGLGIDVDTNRLAARLRRRGVPRGPWLYPLAALLALGRFAPPEVTLDFDDGRTIRRRIALVAVANAPCYGGGMRIAPDAALDDAALDVVVVAAAPARRLVRLLAAVYSGGHVRSPLVEVRRTTRLRISVADRRALQMDGEIVDSPAGAVDVAVEHAALAIVA